MNEEKVRTIIREELAFMVKNKKLVFPYPMQILDGNDITLAQNIGTKIGTSVTQKLAFYGTTPTIKQGAIVAPNVQTGSYVQADAETLRSAVNDIINRLQTVGLIA